ncbi:MAG: hypothetical protein B7733_07980 [Myxococcales bacterium FL481]|nr:MAG: hypothetical protein B7733_07980 [Myxococcales bacterium FL481]
MSGPRCPRVRLALALVGLTSGWPGVVRADVIDEHVHQGNLAARRGDWTAAAQAYGEAERLLPGRSAVVSYNLGTAYAQADRLGLATYHLRRALQTEAQAADAVAEAATRNLGIVRRRAEMAAASEQRQISPPDGVGAVTRALFGSAWVATIAVVGGWACGLLLAARAWSRRRGHDTGRLTAGAVVVAGLTAALAAGHAWSSRIDAATPLAIVVEDAAEARGAAGGRGPVSFVVQGGSQVRIVGQTPGWKQVRLAGGLVGWVPERSVRRFGTS